MKFIDVETSNGVTVLDINGLVPLSFCPPGYDKADAPVSGLQQRWFIRKTDKLRVCLSASREQDKRAWLHVSFSFKNKTPAYKEMTHVKAIFIGPNRPAYMVFPRAEDHYNLHEHCLHLWAPLEGVDPLPDFLAAAGAI